MMHSCSGYRKLGDFLLKDERSIHNRSELPDILASDYLPPGYTRKWTLPTWEQEWQAEMDKQLAHITFKREKEWNHLKWVPMLETEMRTAWQEFLAVVDPQHKQEFANQIHHCRRKPGIQALEL